MTDFAGSEVRIESKAAIDTSRSHAKCSAVLVNRCKQPAEVGEQHVVFEILGMFMLELVSHNMLAPMVQTCKLLQKSLRFKESKTQLHKHQIIIIASDFLATSRSCC
jgi:hypothetical protein